MLEHPDLKWAILQWVGHILEQCCQRIHLLMLDEVGRPFMFAQQLQPICQPWLLAEECDAKGVIKLVILKQLIFWLGGWELVGWELIYIFDIHPGELTLARQ